MTVVDLSPKKWNELYHYLHQNLLNMQMCISSLTSADSVCCNEAMLDTLRWTLHTAHCTLHTTHCTLHTAHTAHCTLHTLLNASYEAKLSLSDLFNLPPLHVNASFAFHISVIREISYAATCSTFLCLSPFPPINLMIKACFTFFGLLLTFYIMRYMLWDYKSNGKWSKEDVVNRLEDGIGSSFRGKRSTTNDQGHLIGVSVFLLKTGI